MRNAYYSPYSWFDEIRRDLNRLSSAETVEAGWIPAVDLSEDDSGYYLALDLPGVNPEDVEVEAHQGKLRISGKREWDSGERKALRNERWSGEFNRSFTLPKHADTDAIEAKYSHGVLALFIPKTKSAEPKRIQISVH